MYRVLGILYILIKKKMHSFIVSLTQMLLGSKDPSLGEHKLKMYIVYLVYSQAQNFEFKEFCFHINA